MNLITIFGGRIINNPDAFLPRFMEDYMYDFGPQRLSHSGSFESAFQNQPDNSTIPSMLGVFNPDLRSGNGELLAL